jgi:hypothetical protein
MSPNPYQAPAALPQLDAVASRNRRPFLLAAIGAWLASVYWALLTLLILFGGSSGPVAGVRSILPLFLIGLYAVRGYQLLQGSTAAAQRILWLHGVGAIAAVSQILSAQAPLFIGLQCFKVVIHAFGAGAAFFALRSAAK